MASTNAPFNSAESKFVPNQVVFAVTIDAAHQCMTTRGVHKAETSTVTCRMTGLFREEQATEQRFFKLISD